MDGLHLFGHLLHLAVLVSHGVGYPAGELVNTTSLRDNMDRTIKFPTDSAAQRKNMESHMLIPGNLSRAASIEDTTFRFPDDPDEPPPIVPEMLMPPKMPQIYAPQLSKRSAPSCAKGSTFCEDVDDYPEAYINSFLPNKVDEYRSFLGTDIVKESGITHKIDGVDEDTLCTSYEVVVFPKVAKNSEDKWFYVVNQESYKQGVRVERCRKNSENKGQAQPCAFTDQFPLGYKTFCKQKYIYRKMLALDDKGDAITDNFELPSCCSCVVKQESLRARIGSLSRLQMTPAPKKPKERQ